MSVRCLIVDDEPLAIDVLKQHIARLDELEIVATCNNAIDAFQQLRRQSVDLLLLDIQMPEMTGLELLQTLQNPPKVILTTAHREYAIEGFELDVVDYLLKPIAFDRFLKAIDKFYESRRTAHAPKPAESRDDFINIHADRKTYQLPLDDIIYIASDRDYIRIVLPDKSIFAKHTIGSIAGQLPEDRFLRIHRSYIVALRRIESFDNTMVEIGKHQFPIGRNYRELVLQQLAKNS